MDYLMSRDGQFVAVQLFQFVPYTYEPVSEKYGIFDGRYLVKHNSNWDDYRFYGFYLIPDEAAEYRNVRAELDINGYSYQDKEFPKADFANLLSSIVIK